MLKIQEIRELIRAIDQSTIEEFKYEQEGTKITLRKEQRGVEEFPPKVMQQAPAVSSQQEKVAFAENLDKEKVHSTNQTNLHKIISPMVGTFYAAPSSELPQYVAAGDKVEIDSVVCIVEAMKLMNEIEAEIKGEIVEVLVENGQLVEYGQVLFLVKSE
ncbi:acetyl-CoA carboxylase biotin carboxyl carrier protein [Bacillaceae bacterium IKA-2]|jgi:acetyl-CoA carboxylase biotin carboxyl carrier protein|nr:acetyl-CoA carboxylase biotin carboxyl carrier protein [Bacillaceae bacterium IKA-2]